MKNKFKNYLKLGILLLGISLTLVNCQKDDELIKTENQVITNSSKISVVDKNFKELNSDTKFRMAYNKAFEKGNKLNQKTIMEENYGFTIDNTTIREISFINGVSYTMSIKRATPNETSFENLIVQIKEDITTAYIVKYTPNSLEYITAHDSFNLNADTEVTPIIYDNSEAKMTVCTTTYYVICNNDGEGGYSNISHSAGPKCNTYLSTASSVSCEEVGSSGSGSGGGGGGSTTPTPDPIDPSCKQRCLVTVPVFPVVQDDDCTLIIPESQAAISDYLVANNNSLEAQNFVAQAKTAICEGGEVDFVDEIILDQTILNNPKVLCVYNTLRANSYTNNSNPETIFDNIISDYFGSSKNANIKFEIGSTPNGEDAVTLPYIGNPSDPNSSSNYKIIIDSSIVNNLSNLEIALIFIHESIHAELIERCFRLGLISSITYQNGNPKIILNANPNVGFDTSEAIYSALASHYYNNGQSPQWNHELFTSTNYLNDMIQNLSTVHTYLNDSSNDFLISINNDPNIVGGPYTLNNVMEYVSWIGLEGTQEYINTIQNNSTELVKKNYIEGVTRSMYNQNCN